MGRSNLTKKQLALVSGSYLIWTHADLVAPLQGLIDESSVISPLIGDFCVGLRSVVQTATLPFQIFCQGVQDRRFDRFETAERIRRLPTEGDLSEEAKAAAYDAACSKMRVFTESEVGSDWLRDAVANEMHQALRSPDVNEASVQLLFHAVVATWTTFEVFCSRLLELLINRKPELANQLLGSEAGKRYFGKVPITVDALASHSFNVADSLGSLLFENRRLDSFAVLKPLIEAVLQTEAVARSLANSELWTLNQRRHVVVHQRGIVDKNYLSKTSDDVPSGARLRVTGGDVEAYLSVVRDTVGILGNAAISRLSI